MRVDDGVHVGTVPVDPQVKSVRRIHHTVAFQEVEIVVAQHDVACLRLVETETEAQHPISARLFSASSDLARQRRFVAFVCEYPARQGDLLPQAPFRGAKMFLHLLARALVIGLFGSYCGHLCLHSNDMNRIKRSSFPPASKPCDRLLSLYYDTYR